MYYIKYIKVLFLHIKIFLIIFEVGRVFQNLKYLCRNQK